MKMKTLKFVLVMLAIVGQSTAFAADPILIGSWPGYSTSGLAQDVAISGDYAYLADGFSGLQVINVSDPSHPFLAGNYTNGNFAAHVVVRGNYAYMADPYHGLQVLDISNPSIPAYVGRAGVIPSAHCIAVNENGVFVADANSGLQVFNVNDASHPHNIYGDTNPWTSYGVTVNGNFVCMADAGPSGLRVFDASNPTNPALVGDVYVPGYAASVVFSGNCACVAADQVGMYVIDISDPANPLFVGNYSISWLTANDTAASGNYVYVAEGNTGIHVLDVRDPTNPVRVGGYDTTGTAYAVVVRGNYAFVADGNEGLKILQLDLPQNTPPILYQNPKSQNRLVGNGIVLGVMAGGSEPLAYSWCKNGTNLIAGGRISDTANATLTISDLQTNDTGCYSVVVTNVYGSVTSAVAQLAVAKSFNYQEYELFPLTLGSSWTYDDGGIALVSQATDNNGVLSATITNKNASGHGAGYLNLVANATEVDVTVYSGPNYIIIDGDMGYTPFVKRPMSLGLSWSESGYSNGYMVIHTATVTATNTTVTIGSNTFQNCYEVTVIVGFPGGYNYTKWVNNKYYFLPGVGCIKRILNSDDGQTLTTQAIAWDIKGFQAVPLIAQPPQSRTNNFGTTASFTVNATGTDPLNYQWKKNGANLSDGINLSGSATTNLIIANVQFADAGSYSVVVSNACGVTGSASAVLAVNDTVPPNLAITSHVNFQLLGVSAITLSGTASDMGRGDNGIAWVKVNGVRATNDTASGSATANWSQGISLILGTNTITVVAADTRTNSATNVIRIISDTAKPTVSITNLVSGQRVSNAVFTVRGTASDNWQVSNVVCQINGGGWNLATNINNWTNWAAGAAPLPGTNVVQAYAVDCVGNVSTTNNVSFQYVVTNQLQIRTLGLGTVSPNYSNAWLEIGRNYSITSAPATGFVFTNWTVSTNWIGGATVTSTNLQFMMQSNLTLQASFVETSNPTLFITAPTAGQHMTNALATVTGTTSDKWGVTGVWYQLNNGAWNASVTTNGWTNWTTVVELITGTNTVKAYAMNLGGNVSTNNSVNMVSSNTFMLQLAFTNSVPLKTDGLVFSLQLSTGLNGRIQVSTNLTSWATLTNFVGTNTTLTFQDPTATNFSRRFYRAVIP
jgi:hypothetical protein